MQIACAKRALIEPLEIEAEAPGDPPLHPARRPEISSSADRGGDLEATQQAPRRSRRSTGVLAGLHRGVAGAPLAHAEPPSSPPAIIEPSRPSDRPREDRVEASLDPADAPTAGALDPAALPRAALEIELAPTFGSTSAHASHYALGPRVLGFALDRFADRYPELDQRFAARFLQLAAVVGLEVPWMVLSHEGGHYRVARELGWKPEIEMTGWMSGLTRYHPETGAKPDARAGLAASAAGVNQEQLNAAYLYRDWARNGTAHWTEAMAYLLAQTNTGLYAARSATRGDDAPSWDDLAAYADGIQARGHRITRGQLAALALGADLLSAPVWATLIGEVKYLAGGGRRIEIPTLKLGGVEATFPNFHTYLDSSGPIVGGHLLINPRAEVPVELSVDARITDGAMAVGAKLYEVPLSSSLTMNPFVRVTSENGSTGARAGVDLQYAVSENVRISGTVSAGAGDLLREVEGKTDGLDGSIKLGLRF